MKTAFWFCLRLCWLRSSESLVVGVASSNRRTKPITKHGHVHCDWFILPLLLPTLTICFSLDHKWQNHKWSPKKMETFWFFQLRFHCTYDCAFTTPLTTLTPTPLLVKTSLEEGLILRLQVILVEIDCMLPGIAL